MQSVYGWWSALMSGSQPQTDEPARSIYSLRIVGTQFPILASHPDGERQPPAGLRDELHLPIRIGIASQSKEHIQNEDTGVAFLSQIEYGGRSAPLGFGLVADGVSGRWGGEYASSVAAQTITNWVIERINQETTAGPSGSLDEEAIRALLANALTAAHGMVRSRLEGSGTTVTCAVMAGSSAHIAHVGDSRAYLMVGNRLHLLTRDHSLSHLLEEQGILSNTQRTRGSSRRSFLYRSIGMHSELEVDLLTEALEPGSLILLCSGGVWKALDDSQTAGIIADCKDPQSACEDLVQKALGIGRTDNATAIILQR